MLYFLTCLILLNFIRKNLKTEETLPTLDPFIKMLAFFGIPILFGITKYFGEKFEASFNFLWIGIIGFMVYLLWLLKSNNLANILQKAIFPFFAISCLHNLLMFLDLEFLKEVKAVVDVVFLGSFFWMVGYGVSARNQQKALKKEEEKNKIILSENEKLEVLVNERTSEILQQKEELEHTLEELKATQNQLIQSEKLASLGELTAGIAHEIQNPLNFVNNFSELNVELIQELQEIKAKANNTSILPKDEELINDLLKDISQNLEKINHHGKRASSIVKGMLQHSRISSGQKELTDINELCDEYLRLSYHGLRAKDKSFNSDFSTSFEEKLPQMEILPQDFGRVLLNLISNAFYAVQQKEEGIKDGTISQEGTYSPLVNIATILEKKWVKIIVKDNGTGIPKDAKSKIFQTFFTTKPTGKGTGLGLSLAYDIVTKGHNGTLEVESNEKIGTQFIIKLPLPDKAE